MCISIKMRRAILMTVPRGERTRGGRDGESIGYSIPYAHACDKTILTYATLPGHSPSHSLRCWTNGAHEAPGQRRWQAAI